MLEASAYLAGEPHSDRPKCVDPAIGTFGRRLNDNVLAIDPSFADQLLPYALKMIGTRTTDEDTRKRAYMAADWAIRTVVPWCYRKLAEHPKFASLAEWAEKLAALAEVVDKETAVAARDLTREAQKAADAAYATDAAYAAYAAATDADAAAYAAYADAAYAAATAAYAAATAAYAAYAFTEARKRAWVELLPSALELLDRMCDVGRTPDAQALVDIVRAAKLGIAA